MIWSLLSDLYMGKVRPVFIKKVSKELVEMYPTVFSTVFEENKLQLQK